MFFIFTGLLCTDEEESVTSGSNANSLLTSGPAGWGSTTSALTASPCPSPPTSSECPQSRWTTGRSSVEARRAWSLCGTTGWAGSSGRFTPGRPACRCCCDPPSQLLRSLEVVSELELVCCLFRRPPHGLGRDRDGTDPPPIHPLQGVLPFTRALHTEKFRFS